MAGHRIGSGRSRQLGLRARITARPFALGALARVAARSSSTIGRRSIRRNLLDQRERLVAERAEVNVGLVADKIGRPDVDAQTLFGSLADRRQAVGARSATPRATPTCRSASTPATAPTAIPDRLTRPGAARPRSRDHALRAQRRGARWRSASRSPSTDGAYFEVNQLDDIDAQPLAASASRLVAAVAIDHGHRRDARLVRPAGACCDRCADIARSPPTSRSGSLDARLAYSEWADDPDLAPLVAVVQRHGRRRCRSASTATPGSRPT